MKQKAIIIGAALIVVTGIILFFSLKISPSSEIINQSQNITELPNETSLVLEQNKFFRFLLNNDDSSIVLNSTSEDSVRVTIQSSEVGIFTIIYVNKSVSFDLDDNGVKDINITLNSIANGKADLHIKRIICNENWECDNWGACSAGNQTRICTDKNHCSTEKNKPSEIQRCQTCSEISGILCSTTQTCNETTISTLDGNCCPGSCVLNSAIVCGDIDCLINAAKNCEIANLTRAGKFVNSTDSELSVTFYYKIRGWKDEKCPLYKEIISMVAPEQPEVIGKNGNCKFSSLYDLEDYLIGEKTNYQLTPEEITDYECAGTLYEN
ncbi:MAG: hypothetical protein PHQ66_02155 [Candidatus Nanoarchaeia archaeon]|nr:hypothetical protein [Candidatus Nanoarchaeia archaeon]MDD5357825.1 hypothetical protein [Candidatus Nanoarchaeia archaeon]MDD5588744.1 hypothetical protein [Candidatus Nanoarchaeia archaeon]